MKATNLLTAKPACVLAVILFAAAMSGQGPRGTVPRASADKYAAHDAQDGSSIGATMLKASQVQKAFSSDLNHCCVAVEVALYPRKDGLIEVSLNSFALRETGKDIATKPSSAAVVAGKLQRKAQPDHPPGTDVAVSPSTGIGYETGGIDPVTGQRRPGGIVTTASVGVGIGGSRAPQPGSTDADLRTMELELREKGLPEGNTVSPVSGYVYFAVPKKDKVSYELVYTTGDKKVVLPLK